MIFFALLQRLFGLTSFALLGVAGWFAWSWREQERIANLLDIEDPSDARLYWAICLLFISLFGRQIMLLALGKGGAMASNDRQEGVTEVGPDGARLRLEVQGREDGPILLLTHAWGMSSQIWADARTELSRRFGVVVWDLPGAGLSSKPRDALSIEGFADDLKALVDRLPQDRPVVLVGHSIGGMTVQTFCARHPQMLNHRVVGVVLENTTHHNPLRTMILSGPVTALQPLIVFMMRVDVLVSPVLWLMNWQSYLSGATHLAMRIAGFGGRPTRAQLELASRLPTKTSPAVQARGNLAMIGWSVTDSLHEMDVPALVFVGDRDLVTKDYAGEFIASAMPSATLVRIGGAGHMGPVEQHSEYVERIASFVDQLVRRPAPPDPTGV